VFIGFSGVALIGSKIRDFGLKENAITLSEYIRFHYDKKTQLSSVSVILFTYMGLLSAQFIALALILSSWSSLNFMWSLILAATPIIFFTCYSGIKGDIYIDALHSLVIGVCILVVLPIFTYKKLPSYKVFLNSLPEYTFDPLHFGGASFLIGGIILGGVLPFVSMEIWQRLYSTSVNANIKTLIFKSMFAILVVYIITVFLGISALVINPNLENSDSVLYILIDNVLPSGLKGLGIAAVLSIIFTTANSMVLVIVASLQRDILPKRLESKYSRNIITVVVIIISVSLALIIPSIVQLVLNSVYILIVLFIPLITALFDKPISKLGAFWSITAGSIATIVCIPFLPETSFLVGAFVSIVVILTIALLNKFKVLIKC